MQVDNSNKKSGVSPIESERGDKKKTPKRTLLHTVGRLETRPVAKNAKTGCMGDGMDNWMQMD